MIQNVRTISSSKKKCYLDSSQYFISVSVSDRSFVSMQTSGNGPKFQYYSTSQPSYFYEQYFDYVDKFPSLSGVRMRIFKENVTNYTNTSYIFFTRKVLISTQNFLSKIGYNIESEELILGTFYGDYKHEIYMVKLGKKSISFKFAPVTVFDRSIVHKGLIYMLFSNYLIVFTTRSLMLCYNFTFINNSIFNQDIDFLDDILIFGRMKKVYFYNTNNFNVYSKSLPVSIKVLNVSVYNFVSIKFDGTYVFISTNISLHQYPYSGHARSYIYEYPNNILNKTYLNVNLCENKTIVLSSSYISKYVLILQYNNSYLCNLGRDGCSSCRLGYYLLDSICHLIDPVFVEDEVFGDQVNDTDDEIEFNQNYTYVDQDQSLNNTNLSQNCQNQNKNVSVDQQGRFGVGNKEALKKFSTTFASTLTIFTLNIFPKIFISFVSFIEDIWLYQYHRDFDPKYPSTVHFFLQQASFIGQLKISPSFMNFMNKLEQQSVGVVSNQKYVQYLNLTKIEDIKNVYFLNSTQFVYKQNLIMNIIFYVLIKILHIILKNMKNRYKMFRKVYLHFKRKTGWWTLLIPTIQANIMILGFNVSLQFLLPSNFQWQDKFNLGFTILVFFVLIIYSLCFFVLVFHMTPKCQSKQLLGRCRFQAKSFFFELMMAVTRQLFRSIIHGLFIFNHSYQITILTIFDIFYILIIISMKKCFVKNFIYFLVILYNINLFIFDLYFLLEIYLSQITKNCDRELFGFICLSCMVLIALVQTLFCIFQPFYQMIRQKCYTNNLSISPQANVLKKKSERLQTFHVSIKNIKTLKDTNQYKPNQTNSILKTKLKTSTNIKTFPTNLSLKFSQKSIGNQKHPTFAQKGKQNQAIKTEANIKSTKILSKHILVTYNNENKN